LLQAEKSFPQAVGESESTESFPQAVGGLPGTHILVPMLQRGNDGI